MTIPTLPAGAEPVRVLIAADDPLARAGLAALLAESTDCTVLGQIDAAALMDGDSLERTLTVYQPDALLWDVGWEADSDEWPDLREVTVPVVALIPEADAAPEVWQSGARGVLLRRASADQLAVALRAAACELAVLDPALAGSLTRVPAVAPAADLTPREIDVVTLLAEGLANRAIAAHLGISEHTVKFHLNAILTKLGAQSRTEAVVQAIRAGIIAL